LNGIFWKFLERFLPSLPIGLPATKARDLRYMSSAALACSPAGICALCCTIGHKYTTFLHTLCRITAYWKTLRSSKVF
jgi:hypothetical protein